LVTQPSPAPGDRFRRKPTLQAPLIGREGPILLQKSARGGLGATIESEAANL